MKKKVSLIVIIMLAAAFALAGCSGSNAGEKKEEKAATATEASKGEAVFAFSNDGKQIMLDADMEDIKQLLGKEKEYTEAQSCAFEGLDKTFYYGSYYVSTYPDGDKDRVNMIWFADDTVETDEGISIGDSEEKVLEAYGQGQEAGAGGIVYVKGNTKLTFIIDNGSVADISYELIHE